MSTKAADMVPGFRDSHPEAAALVDAHEALREALDNALKASADLGSGTDDERRDRLAKLAAAMLGIAIVPLRFLGVDCPTCGRMLPRKRRP